jgi:hypothetical protein
MRIIMPDTINVSGLDEQDVSLLEALVKRLREKTVKKVAEEKEDFAFASWALGRKCMTTSKASLLDTWFLIGSAGRDKI